MRSAPTRCPSCWSLTRPTCAGRARANSPRRTEGSVWVSALTGENLDELIATIGERLRTHDRVVTLSLPLDRGDLIAAAHREGEVIDTSITDEGVVVHVVLDPVGVARFEPWRVPA